MASVRVLIVFLSGLICAAEVSGDCGDCGWTQIGNRCFAVIGEKKTQSEARAACKQQGATLAIIYRKEEQDFITGEVKQMDSNAWIGLNDIDDEGWFAWQDEYTHWHIVEPNNPGAEHCTIMNWKPVGQWNDVPCKYAKYYYLCQKFADKCPKGWYKHGAKCFRVFTDKRYSQDAYARCRQQGGELGRIEGPKEMAAVAKLSRAAITIGYTEITANGRKRRFSWKPRYLHWGIMRNSETVDCVSVCSRTGKWVNEACSAKMIFSCSKEA